MAGFSGKDGSMVKKLLIIVGIMVCLVSNARAGDLKLRHYFNDSLSIGIDKGAAISYYDIKDTELLGGYVIPLVLYEFPDDEILLKDYTVSFDGGVIGDSQNWDGALGLGTNAPLVVTNYVIKKFIGKEIPLTDKIKLGFIIRANTERLFNEGEIAGSYGIEFGWKF